MEGESLTTSTAELSFILVCLGRPSCISRQRVRETGPWTMAVLKGDHGQAASRRHLVQHLFRIQLNVSPTAAGRGRRPLHVRAMGTLAS